MKNLKKIYVKRNKDIIKIKFKIIKELVSYKYNFKNITNKIVN